MVTREQLVNGMLKYIDSDIMPVLSTGARFGLGTAIVLFTERYDNFIDQLANNELIKTFNIFDSNGMIDIDSLSNAMTKSASKYGSFTLEIPMLGAFSFNENDIRKIVGFVKGGTEQ